MKTLCNHSCPSNPFSTLQRQLFLPRYRRYVTIRGRCENEYEKILLAKRIPARKSTCKKRSGSLCYCSSYSVPDMLHTEQGLSQMIAEPFVKCMPDPVGYGRRRIRAMYIGAARMIVLGPMTMTKMQCRFERGHDEST